MTQSRRNIAAGILVALMVAHAYGGHHHHIGTGPIHGVIVHESQQDTPDFSIFVGALRNGDSAKYWSTDNRYLDIFDEDAKDENGVPRVKKEDVAPLDLPALLIYSKDGKLIHHEHLTKSATAASVMAIAKGWGG